MVFNSQNVIITKAPPISKLLMIICGPYIYYIIFNIIYWMGTNPVDCLITTVCNISLVSNLIKLILVQIITITIAYRLVIQ